MTSNTDERAALLDAAEVLSTTPGRIVHVGAQAIYLHTGAADLAVAEFTTDADSVSTRHPFATRRRSKSYRVARVDLQSGRRLAGVLIDNPFTSTS